MKDDVGLIHEFRQQLAIFQRLKEVVHPVIFLEMPDIFHAAGRKIIHQPPRGAAWVKSSNVRLLAVTHRAHVVGEGGRLVVVHAASAEAIIPCMRAVRRQ